MKNTSIVRHTASLARPVARRTHRQIVDAEYRIHRFDADTRAWIIGTIGMLLALGVDGWILGGILGLWGL